MVIFFFKQKTAYEMRISDWSSDVCSSDLYEVRSAKDAFSSIPKRKISDEMLELAEHIIKTKRGSFDPAKYDDRYEEALADLVKAKLEGREIKPRKDTAPTNVVNLIDALRERAGVKKTKAAPNREAAKTKSTSGGKRKTETRARNRKAGGWRGRSIGKRN